MSKPIPFFVAGVLSTIAVAAMVILPTWMVATTFDLSNNGETSYDLVQTVPSPDGAHLAMIYTSSGGGAAGWCSQHVAITKKDVTFDSLTKVKDSPSQVFNSTCRSEFELTWKNGGHLVITYSFTGSPEYGDHTFQKILSEDKEVKISFVSK